MPTENDLEDILEKSRRNNRAANITGVLLFHDGNFLQVLEGDNKSVLACYERIGKDTRHRSCFILQSEYKSARTFADWDMAYVPFSKLGPAQQGNFISLKKLGETSKMHELAQDKEINIFVNSFLSGFRDLNIL